MNFLLIAMIIILLFVIALQYFVRRKTNHQLKEMGEKLFQIIEQRTDEKVFVQTTQHDVQQLLIQVNRLLNYNQKVFADSVKAKESLRKMLSNMSHDLKTPLTVVLGYIEKLKQNDKMAEEEQNEVVERLHKKTLSIIVLTDQFFDLVKLESGDSDLPISRLTKIGRWSGR